MYHFCLEKLTSTAGVLKIFDLLKASGNHHVRDGRIADPDCRVMPAGGVKHACYSGRYKERHCYGANTPGGPAGGLPR